MTLQQIAMCFKCTLYVLCVYSTQRHPLTGYVVHTVNQNAHKAKQYIFKVF